MDVFCIGLIFSRNQPRYRDYAFQYLEVLLGLQKQVAIFSPNWIEWNNFIQVNFRHAQKRVFCFPIEETQETTKGIQGWAFFLKCFRLRRSIGYAEQRMKTKIDFVYFAPVDDWIKPNFSKAIFKRMLPYKWSGLITKTHFYDGILPLNVDPKYGEYDYLFTDPNCIGVSTLNRFNSENLKSRVYKKVIVMPDVSDFTLGTGELQVTTKLQKMIAGRMVIGTILQENENVDSFFQLASFAPEESYFFVCIGRFDPKNLTDVSSNLLAEVLQNTKNNTFISIENTEDNEEINELINFFDMCYLCEGASEIPHALLTRAAYFNKPVIGSSLGLSGKLISAFELGLISNGDTKDCLFSLEALRKQMPLTKNIDPEPFRNYAKLQSKETLKDCWETLLLF